MSAPTATIVTHTSVAPDHIDDFHRWQQQVNDTITRFSGYLDHSVIPPNPPLQTDWVIIQRFQTIDAARTWLQSTERQQLLDTLQPVLIGPSDIHLFTENEPSGSYSPVSVVISTRVKPGQQEAFLRWHRRISALQGRFEGFQGYKFEPPIPGVQEDWVTILRFDSDAHLETWLNSEARKQMVQEAEAFSLDTRLRKVGVGFDAWFRFADGQQQSSLPSWKVNMLVLLALYPTVFLFSTFVQTPLLLHRGTPFWLALFIGNTFSTAMLGWILVPYLSKLFSWWLDPLKDTSVPTRTITLGGTVLILAIYAALLFVFSLLP